MSEILLAPAPIPSGSILDSPGVTICISEEWIPVIDGVIGLLADQFAWQGTETERLDAKGQIDLLLSKLEAGTGCI